MCKVKTVFGIITTKMMPWHYLNKGIPGHYLENKDMESLGTTLTYIQAIVILLLNSHSRVSSQVFTAVAIFVYNG